MLNLFRKIRRSLFESGKTRKYIFYAIGEISLVVIGILIALQVNTWNNSRIQKKQFFQSIEQIYNSVYTDVSWSNLAVESTQMQIDMIMIALNNPDSMDPVIFAHSVFQLEILRRNYNSNTPYLLSNIQVNLNNQTQKEMAKQISGFARSSVWNLDSDSTNPYYSKDYLSPIFEKHQIPAPNTFLGINFMNPEDIDLQFFTEEELIKINKLVKTKEFRIALRSLLSKKEAELESANDSLEDGISILRLIETHYPKMHLLFDNLGIIGNALPTGWEESVQMQLIDEKKSIWQTTIELGEGAVKFRNRDSWKDNWGGTTFPKGETLYFGGNIIVEPGKYEVTLDLTANSYEFVKLD